MIGNPKIGQTAEVNYYWTLNHMPLYGPDHGLRTPSEGINQRNLKIWADVADKVCFSRT